MRKMLFWLLALLLASGCADLVGTSTPVETSTTARTPSASPVPVSMDEALVIRVVDGDTIVIEIGEVTRRARYIGIDAPEQDEPGFEEATAFNEGLVAGEVVRLERDVSETDKYGRLLRYVYVGSCFVNGELVRQGYAHAGTYPPDVKYQETLLELEREAREAGRGLWAH